MDYLYGHPKITTNLKLINSVYDVCNNINYIWHIEVFPTHVLNMEGLGNCIFFNCTWNDLKYKKI